MIYKNDIIVLKSINVDGFVCQRGHRVIFEKMDGYWYCCTPGIKIQHHHIYQIIEPGTNMVTYQSKVEDGL